MGYEAGRVLGPYKIERLLGSGGMGEVYQAVDSRLDRKVAIKVISGTFASDPERLQRFEQEAKILSALNHPNIITIHGLETLEGTLSLVTERLEGETLRVRLDAKPIPQKKALEIAIQVARGLAAAHGKGIVHRDLKPENIFLTKDGLVKILDFGIAKMAWKGPSGEDASTGAMAFSASGSPMKTSEGRILGTASYMSPEQIRMEKLDARTDIFSLGVILWEMITGTRPFQGDGAVLVMTSILKEDLPELDPALNVSPELQRTMEYCLNKQPESRYHSAHDLALALESLVGLSGSAFSTSSYRKLSSSRAAAGWKYAVPVLSGLMVAACLVFALTRPRAAQPEYRQINFKNGLIHSARFTPDGKSVIYNSTKDGLPWQSYIVSLDSLEERPIGPVSGQILAVSVSGEVAYLLDVEPTDIRFEYPGVLATAPRLEGLIPKERQRGVRWVDYDEKGQIAGVINENEKVRIEYPLGQIRYTSTGWISNLRVSPKGDALAFIEHPIAKDDIGYVCLLSIKDKQPRRLTKQWSGSARGLAWRGDEIWFTATDRVGGRMLWASNDRQKLRKVLAVPSDLLLHDISKDGQVLLAREDSACGFAIGRKGEKTIRGMATKPFSFVSAISIDGRYILVEEQTEHSDLGYRIYLRSVDGKENTFIGEGMNCCLSPDAKWVAAIQLKPEPHPVLLPMGPGQPRVLPSHGIKGYGTLAWSKSGKLAFTGFRAGQPLQLHIQDVKTEIIQSLPCKGMVTPITSFLSDYLLYTSEEGVVMLDLATGKRRVFAANRLDNCKPLCWFKDSQQFLVMTEKENQRQIWTLDLESGKKTPYWEFSLLHDSEKIWNNLRWGADDTWVSHYSLFSENLFLVKGLN